MRYTPFLITNLRRLFTVVRVLLIGVLLLSPLSLIPTDHTLIQGTVQLAAPSKTGRENAAVKGDQVELRQLTARVRLRGSSDQVDLRRLATTVGFPRTLAVGVICLLVICTFRSLLLNAEAGIIFELENVALLRRLAWVTLLNGLVFKLLESWASYRVGAYLTLHGELGDLTAATVFEHVTRAAPSLLGALIEAAVIFVLAEVFRYGVSLKQDTDLTV